MDIYQETEKLYNGYKIEKKIIGKSVLGRNIYAFKVGEGSPVGLAQYAMHGREFITARLAFLQMERGIHRGSVWFVPLVNPDGALLSEVGISSVHKQADKALLYKLNGGEDFSLWKANARGVDLNVNFPALWGKGAKNVFEAGAENYVGKKPLSEPETLALHAFTKKVQPDYTVSYHTKGEEVYWYFYQGMRFLFRDKALAISISKSTGYPLAYAKNSVGGYKDWCIQTLKIPAFTIEAGSDNLAHPLQGDLTLQSLWERNKDVIYNLAKEYVSRV